MGISPLLVTFAHTHGEMHRISTIIANYVNSTTLRKIWKIRYIDVRPLQFPLQFVGDNFFDSGVNFFLKLPSRYWQQQVWGQWIPGHFCKRSRPIAGAWGWLNRRSDAWPSTMGSSSTACDTADVSPPIPWSGYEASWQRSEEHTSELQSH